MKKIIFFLFLILYCSCNNVDRKLETLKGNKLYSFLHDLNNKRDIKKLVKEWQNKEILFPENMSFAKYGKDTVDFDFWKADYKVLIYIDSMECVGCNLNLLKWKGFMNHIDSVTEKKVSFLYVFNPKTIKDLYKITRKVYFTYPVVADTNDDLNKINKFPKENIFHTFLLNKQNKVCAIGNPIRNPNIKDIYVEILSNNKIETIETTKIDICQNIFDIGVLRHDTIIEEEVIIHNIGKTDFVLKEIDRKSVV